MRDSVMLYKHPGPHDIHGDKFDYMVCHQNEMDKYLADGWYLTTTEAKAAFESDSVPSNDVEKQEIEPEIKSGTELEPAKTIPPSQLTEAQKSNIRIAEGTQREIAKKFNVSTFTVSRIKNGKIK